MPDSFEVAYSEYMSRWSEAREVNASHDHLRHLFISFLRDAFPGLQSWEFDLERHIKVLGVRGFIDLLYRQLVFEFKRDLAVERDAGLDELKLYLQSQPEPHRTFGILTDGGSFEVYVLRDGELQPIDAFKLQPSSPTAARLMLDSYLFAGRSVPPTAENIVRRFGEYSLVFHTSAGGLRRAFSSVRDLPSVKTKFAEWNNLLVHVYGTLVGNEELFVRHTYLTLLARLLAYIALQGRTPVPADLPGVVDGAAFRPFGIGNLVDGDFFAWVLEEPASTEARIILSGLAAHLAVYDLTRLNEDVLKELYQHLVDPYTRHELGEYYTPDWLAERTLREAGFGAGKSMLDPSCGSGTFLFTAVRLLREAGVSGETLVRAAFEDLAGLDVHPVAVMIAKVNLLLALLPDLRGRTIAALPPIPVFMADTLRLPLQSEMGAITIPVHIDARDVQPPRGVAASFIIPRELTTNPPDLDRIIMRTVELASQSERDEADLLLRLRTIVDQGGYGGQYAYLASNFRLLRWLMSIGRDTVWSFILRNAFRPTYFASRQFDLVAGNPPWLSYGFIARGDYQNEVKSLVKAYGLIAPRAVHLFTRIDLSTLFFAHCIEHFVRPDGTIAFVMPRSTITGAKQHAGFQAKFAFSRVIDLQGVTPLFNVPACVLLQNKAMDAPQPTPTVKLRGVLPRKNASAAEARAHLVEEIGTFTPLHRPTQTSPYFSEAAEGAAIGPRSLWFVRSPAEALVINPERPQLETDPEVARNGKKPWLNVTVRGEVEDKFLFATLLAEDLVPFGLRRFRLVVLPLVREELILDKSLRIRNRLLTSAQAQSQELTGLAEWMAKAEREWGTRKKSTTTASITEWLDYQGKLTDQDPRQGYKALYNRSGTNIAACVIDAFSSPEVNSLVTNGIVVDQCMFWISCATEQEAHYLSAYLNAPYVNEHIKPYQTQGLFGALHGGGERDITRLPFELLPFPRFDTADSRHVELAAISADCHARVLSMGSLVGQSVARARQRVRGDLHSELSQIDGLVKDILGSVVAHKGGSNDEAQLMLGEG